MDCLCSGKSQQVCCEFLCRLPNQQNAKHCFKNLTICSSQTYFYRQAEKLQISHYKNYTQSKALRHQPYWEKEPYIAYTSEKAQPKNHLFFQKPYYFGFSVENLFLDMKDYQYNIRGWLTDINNTSTLTETGAPQKIRLQLWRS